MDDQIRIQVLLSALEERYKATHAIRERVYNICIWTLGVFLALTAWIVQGELTLSLAHKAFLCAALLVALIGVRCLYLGDIENGFRKQLRVAARIEEILGLYEPGRFDSSQVGLYPAGWREAGGETGSGKCFQRSYWLLYIGVGVLVVAILLQGCVL